MIIPLTIAVITIANITFAQIDATRISKGKRIKHGINGLIYASLLGIVYLLSHSFLLVNVCLWLRLVVFNISLNLFRKLPVFYISPDPKSIIDKAVKPLGKWVYAIYILGIIISIFIL